MPVRALRTYGRCHPFERVLKLRDHGVRRPRWEQSENECAVAASAATTRRRYERTMVRAWRYVCRTERGQVCGAPALKTHGTGPSDPQTAVLYQLHAVLNIGNYPI